jgi:hypothetical protein
MPRRHALDPITLADLTPEARKAERRLREIETLDVEMDSGGYSGDTQPCGWHHLTPPVTVL